jgi:uncharacterized integral membrane protein
VRWSCRASHFTFDDRQGVASGAAMSTPAQTPQTPGKNQPKVDKRNNRETARTAGLVVLAVLITLFAVFNLKDVKVSYVFGTGKAPLIIVIVISLLVGIVLAYFADRRPKKKR